MLSARLHGLLRLRLTDDEAQQSPERGVSDQKSGGSQTYVYAAYEEYLLSGRMITAFAQFANVGTYSDDQSNGRSDCEWRVPPSQVPVCPLETC